MTSWSHYAKCWECGAEASHCCVGDDGKEAIEVCDDRVLVVDDRYAKIQKNKNYSRSRRRAAARRSQA